MDDANPEGKQENTEDLSGAAPPDFLSADLRIFPAREQKISGISTLRKPLCIK